jgi:DNA-binding NtrC family response regulator
VASNEHVPGELPRASHPTIMVVATDPTILKLLAMALKLEYECEVLTFTSERSLLETAKHSKPDLMIIYSQLLGLSALELADRLHSIKGFENVPTILTHAPVASWGQRQHSHLIVLSMPFMLEELYAGVTKALTAPDDGIGESTPVKE